MFLVAVLALTLSQAAGQTVGDLDQWIQRHSETVEAYRRGDTARALTLLGTMTAEEQEKAVAAIAAQLARIAAGWPATKEDVPWPHNSVRALAAIHFEAALTASKGRARDEHETVEHHIGLARALFDLLPTAGDRGALRWITAIALVQIASAGFADADRVVKPHCQDEHADAALLVVCGTIDETYASLSAEQVARVRAPAVDARTLLADRTLSASMRGFVHARNLRATWLASARKHFEKALARNSSDPEAQLRLAQVLLQQKHHDHSAALLEKLAARSDLDARTHYLAHLFLGRVRLRQGRLDPAAHALSRLKPLQSALLARAQLAQQRGDAREAAVLAGRASTVAADDPWWGYRFGQYWVYDALLEQLRAEARKR